ncbi:GNAT family N-acetyltransferase [Sphingobacteriales bacterium UPWRP_1]|nr:hypothetical protein B6N25_09290 [Sphingobacteriales bacterium TSM_CSS]PSJ77476.1 GNAT family N-acetyltransferase [Sphingobacteriales bacterium UPWRP_1]
MELKNIKQVNQQAAYLQLCTQRLILSVLKGINTEELLRYAAQNEPFWREWSPVPPPKFFTVSYQREKLKNEIEQLLAGAGIRFYLFLQNNSQQIIGDIHFSNIIGGAFQSCFLGYKIAQSHAGQGYITEALQTAIPWLFSTLRLHRIEANIMPGNRASVRVAEKLGFQNEGLARKYLKINGIWEDHFHYVLLNEQAE